MPKLTDSQLADTISEIRFLVRLCESQEIYAQAPYGLLAELLYAVDDTTLDEEIAALREKQVKSDEAWEKVA